MAALLNGLSSELKSAIKTLGEATEKRSHYAEKMKQLDVTISGLTESIQAQLNTGSYKAGDWVVNISEAIKKTRMSTSWKAIAEAMRGAVITVKDFYTEKFPAAAEPLGRMANNLESKYQKYYDDNTNLPEEKVEKTITVSRLTNA